MPSGFINKSLIQQFVADNSDLQKAEQNLLALGYDNETITANLNEYKRIKIANRQFAGFIYLVVGGFLGFISCVLTVFNPIPELYNWILFGLTSISILLICLGLYKLFE